MLILMIVIFTVGISVAQIVKQFIEPSKQFIMDLTVVLFFSVELFLRFVSHYHHHRVVSTFMTEVFNVLDLFLIVFDVVLITVNSANKGYALNAARASKGFRVLKVLRFLRLLRIFRAARLVRKLAKAAKTVAPWFMPLRYTNMTDAEVRCCDYSPYMLQKNTRMGRDLLAIFCTFS